MEVFIAFVKEPYEAPVVVGVFTTAALAHRAVAEALEKFDRYEGGHVRCHHVHETLHGMRVEQ